MYYDKDCDTASFDLKKSSSGIYYTVKLNANSNCLVFFRLDLVFSLQKEREVLSKYFENEPIDECMPCYGVSLQFPVITLNSV